jgi:hypothetical protein
MAVSSQVAIFSQANSAAFQAWVQEIYTNLVTNCGLSQLSASMDSGQMAVPCATALPGGATTSAGYYMFRFSDSLSTGPVATGNLVALTAGTGYNGGSAHTYSGVAMAGGTGSGAIATVTLGSSGVVSSINITTSGTGYLVGDQLIVTSANIVAAGGASGGGSSGFAFVGALTAGSISSGASAPVVIKLEFGTGNAVGDPMMWVTISNAWTSNGTLSGSAGTTAMTRVAAAYGGIVPNSLTTPYISRYCVNSTYGFLGMVFKIGSVVLAADQAYGGLMIFRTNDGNGNPTSNGVVLLTNGIGAAVPSGNYGGCIQIWNQSGSQVYPTGGLTGPACGNWQFLNTYTGGPNNTPYELVSTYQGGTVFVMPILTIDPVWRFNAYVGEVFPNDIPIHTSFPAAIIGANALTFLQVGLPFGSQFLGPYSGSTKARFVMLWQ